LRRGLLSRPTLGGVAFALACAAGGLAVGGFAAPAKALDPSPTVTDPEPAPDPSPDPAPTPPPPKPKPKPKPAAKPRPAPVYHAPTHARTPRAHTTSSRAYKPTYRRTPKPARAPARAPAVPKRVLHRVKHRARPAAPRARAVVPKVTPARTSPRIPRIEVGPQTGAVTPPANDGVRRQLIIAALAVASLLFFLIVAVPSTAARATAAGRMVRAHDFDLLLAGLAALVLAAILLAVTEMGS
jgi:hypothetical protein